jgi:5-methylcytosine-specific restriction endonuclease McrA
MMTIFKQKITSFLSYIKSFTFVKQIHTNSVTNSNLKVKIKNPSKKSEKRKNIPCALREQVWLKHFGKTFENKCSIKWCTNIISVYNWECGHNIPHSKGGLTVLENLVPLCSRCNKSMNDNYTIDEFDKLG